LIFGDETGDETGDEIGDVNRFDFVKLIIS